MTFATPLLLALLTSGAVVVPSVSAASTGSADEVVSTDEFNRRIKLTTLAMTTMPGDSVNISRLYQIMFEACETALTNNAHPSVKRPLEAWQGAFCSCDAMTTIDKWLLDPQMKLTLEDFNMSPTYEKYTAIISKHEAFKNNAYCRSGIERLARGQP